MEYVLYSKILIVHSAWFWEWCLNGLF